MTNPTIRAVHDAVVKTLVDQGKLIEAGFAAYRAVMMPPDASDNAVSVARVMYMSGAQHLFASIMSILDPGSEPTAADLNRMSLIAAELEAFASELELRVAPTGATQ